MNRIKTFRTLALVACLLTLTGCPAKEDPPPMPRDTPEQVAAVWAKAIEEVDGGTACELLTPRGEEILLERGKAFGVVLEHSINCVSGFEDVYEYEEELGRNFELREITVTEETDKTAYVEIAWQESEDGDGSGIGLVKRKGEWLIERH